MPDEDAILEEPIGEDDGDNDAQTEEECSEKTSPKLSPEEREMDNKSTNTYSNANSPASVLSNQDPELESSQREDETSRGSKSKDETASTGNSLEKMRAAYANFLSDSYWTGVDLKVAKSASKANCDSTNGSATNATSNTNKGEFDWHQDALSKTLQQTVSPKPTSKPNLFSSVHLYRQSAKPCGSVFTGASRFRCKDCSAAYDTLVELTVHMNKSGHYQDNNHSKQSGNSASSSKSRKRSLQDLEGKEDAQKVLKCMFCGHSFDSLQDLSVHMIKTKHYQKVPLKEPIPVLTPKLLPPAKKRAFEVARPCSPDSTTGVPGFTEAQRAANMSNANNNRYGYQNGASYTWQFETCKSQILKCMECGSSHDTLQQLTTHMMVTGHFIKVTNSASKKGKQLTLDPLAIEKMQGLAEPALARQKQRKTLLQKQLHLEEARKIANGCASDKMEESGGGFEKETSGGGDILKSLANTVASAINKAQTGTPSWSAYPSIHAAYQLSGIIKSPPLSTSPPAQLKHAFNHKLRAIAPKGKLYSPPPGQPHHNTDIKKEKVCDGKESIKFDLAENDDSDCQDESSCSSKGKTPPSPCSGNGRGTSEATSDTRDMLAVNPLSALQSVLNTHLGKANKPNSSSSRQDKLAAHAQAIFADMNRSSDSRILGSPVRSKSDNPFLFVSDDQPIDLTKSKHSKTSMMQSSTPVPQKYALSDIADMVKVLPKATTPNRRFITTPDYETGIRRSEIRRRVRGSLLRAQTQRQAVELESASPAYPASSVRVQLIPNVRRQILTVGFGPQERMQISKFTGLSMTTISHWLANVKYQLRKTGGTKFLKNMDSGHPVFYCNDCASQFRSPATFITHLESHLGFQIKDMCKMPVEHHTKVDEPELPKALSVRLPPTV
ncbi:hypothetical protein WMY93_017711 [Mugilogobius chulae]|uniref:C2H2-type domain-containing protein n=1 Tax=Mugilogobius chulae TaxID=88201 RepID=A0AAW0P172_9GOBI